MPGFWQRTCSEAWLGTWLVLHRLVFLLFASWGESPLFHSPHSLLQRQHLPGYPGISLLTCLRKRSVKFSGHQYSGVPSLTHLTGYSDMEPSLCLWPPATAQRDLRHPWCRKEAIRHCSWGPHWLPREGAVLL